MNRALLLHLVAILVIAFLPQMGGYPIFLMKIMCYALFACAFNLLLGYVGLLSFGHAAFVSVAAYACGQSLAVWGWPTWAGLLFGTVGAGALGLVFGVLSVRRSGIYLAMITLALAQMLYFYFLQASFTGGEDGLHGIPRGSFLGLDLRQDIELYYLVLAIFVMGYAIIWRTVHSPFGQALKAIRENEPRMISLGYNTDRFKLLAFVISASLSGLAGATKSLVFVSASLSDATWHMSGMVILMTLIGGMGTLTGPVLGAVIMVALENKVGVIGRFLMEVTGIEWFRVLGESVTIVIGLIFVVCVMAFRRGIVGEWLHFRERRRLQERT
ncbi:MAG: branched-chain amino acid ABC transporter permease [Castellaniella sp.]